VRIDYDGVGLFFDRIFLGVLEAYQNGNAHVHTLAAAAILRRQVVWMSGHLTTVASMWWVLNGQRRSVPLEILRRATLAKRQVRGRLSGKRRERDEISPPGLCGILGRRRIIAAFVGLRPCGRWLCDGFDIGWR
jgi:hypothetical protein